jgi:transcriptional regulator with GAF, ATPase, and Fis domain
MDIDTYLDELFDKEMSLNDKIDSLKVSLIVSALCKRNGNMTKAARDLSMDRSSATKFLAKKLKKK